MSTDTYTLMAADVFGVRPEAVTPDMRKRFKTAVFNILYRKDSPLPLTHVTVHFDRENSTETADVVGALERRRPHLIALRQKLDEDIAALQRITALLRSNGTTYLAIEVKP